MRVFTICLGIIGLVISVTGIGGAIFLAVIGVSENAKVDRWLAARPMDTTVDLSRPGEITAPFRQSCYVPACRPKTLL